MLAVHSRCFAAVRLIAILVLFPGFTRVRAETLDEIKGLSVTISWAQHVVGTVHDVSGLRHLDTNNNRSISIYISTKGNVFEYPAESNKWNFGPTVTSINQAGSLGNDQMMAWTMTAGHLNKVIKAIRGFVEYRIAIDPYKLSCTFDLKMYPDPQTGTMISNSVGTQLDAVTLQMIGCSCTVKKGNVFASTTE